MISKWVIACQIWEWYGDSDNVGAHYAGRYKPKGGESFVFEMPYEEFHDFPVKSCMKTTEDELMDLWDKKFNKTGQWVRYEAKSIEPYYEPQKASFVDGEFNIVRE